uniref:Orf277 n=2 Tax=Brassica TaxID=3705 RepID=G4XYQ1_BRACI|nr:orf277 [Brassica carinata]YP_009228134.1 hypothetical protein AYB38_gp14 [Brassica nigra]AEH43606.1 orf277 [Brassica carinata]AJD85429.1 hypothetical protein BniMp064 [Brassica nigra]
MRPGRARALRQFTLSTGKSAGRNSSGHITVKNRGGILNLFLVFFITVVISFLRIKVSHLLGGQALPLLEPIIWAAVGGEALPSTGPNGSSMWEEDPFELGVLEESFSDSKTAGESHTEESEPSVNQLPPQEAGPSVPYQDQGLPTDRNGNPMDLNARPSPSSLYNEIESSDSLRARNLQLEEDLEQIHLMEQNLQNERDPDRRREVSLLIDWKVRKLERKISLCQDQDTVRDDQLDVWREGLYEELATQGEKQARLTLLNSWLKVIIHTRNHQPPKN